MRIQPILILLFTTACSTTGPSAVEESGLGLNSELRDELLSMLEQDQQIREQGHRVLIVGESGDHAPEQAEGAAPHEHTQSSPVHGDEMHRVDAANTLRLKEIIAEHGWPGASLVESDGACAAFLIAQHADADPEFQRRCLELMQKAPPGEVSPGDIAYLTDRVRVNSGQPQLYGTQFWIQDGSLVPRPIENPDELDARREEAGLIPMSEYVEHMRSHDGH